MNPVDTHVGEEQEGNHTQEEPRPTCKYTHVMPPCSGISLVINDKIKEQLRADEDAPQLTQRRFIDPVVQFAVSSNFSEKQSHSRDADPGQ